MSSHREAPVDQPGPGCRQRRHLRVRQPGRPDTVTIITNYVPLQGAAGGPNFFEFGDDVLYSIYIDNDGDALPEIDVPVPVQRRRSRTRTRSSTTPGRSRSLTDPNWNKRQLYDVS